MTSDLASDLESVDGVGEKTAEKLISVLEEGGYLDGGSEASGYQQKAERAADRGEYRMAGIYLNRAGGE